MVRTSIPLLFTLCILTSQSLMASAPDYLEVIRAEGKRDAIETVRSSAHVIVSDGLEYDVETLFHDRQRAIFHRAYSDRTVTLGVDGKYIWSFDGEREAEVDPFLADVVLGHQFHAQLLFFDELHGPLGEPVEVDCDATRCLSLPGTDRRSLLLERANLRPHGMRYARDHAADTAIAFDDWREVDGIELPFLIRIDDGERVFEYQFSSVSLEGGSMSEFRAPFSVLTDEQKLIRLHRTVMDAHLFEDAGLLEGHFGPRSVVVSDGEIHDSGGKETEALLRRIFTSRDYTRYDDLVRPIVRISEDGTLGWVIVQVGAEGARYDASGNAQGRLAFTSAWISLFEKIDDEWKVVGNVSNFKPGRM